MQFEFATATRIVFGPGKLAQVGPLATEMGSHALVVTGQDRTRAAQLLDALAAQGMTYGLFSVPGEPTVQVVRQGTEQARQAMYDLVIGFGGGSALDAAKAIAALAANDGDPLDYVEVIGKGRPLTRSPLPYIAIPTTAGTGAEVTRNAVLASPEHRVKVSLRNPLMLPRLALVDPELTYRLPPKVTASTGLDALAQLIEPYVSSRATPLTDALCREGMRCVARSLRRAFEGSRDPVAREEMALASLFGGLALANAGLGAVHGFAGPIGGMFPSPHGAVCARLLPFVMAMNLRAMRQRFPENLSLRRYDEVAQLLTGTCAAIAADGIAWVQALIQELHILPLSAYGMRTSDLAAVAEKAALASSMQSNPVKLRPDEMEEILTQAL